VSGTVPEGTGLGEKSGSGVGDGNEAVGLRLTTAVESGDGLCMPGVRAATGLPHCPAMLLTPIAFAGPHPIGVVARSTTPMMATVTTVTTAPAMTRLERTDLIQSKRPDRCIDSESLQAASWLRTQLRQQRNVGGVESV
jgi:hypothetical protein